MCKIRMNHGGTSVSTNLNSHCEFTSKSGIVKNLNLESLKFVSESYDQEPANVISNVIPCAYIFFMVVQL